MVDPERLHRLLRRIADDLALLRRYAGVDREELVVDAVRLGHMKYLFVTMLEGCIDAAHHVCAADGYGPPETNAAAMLLLARHEVVSRELGSSMAQAVRFRNVLVHGYAEVDDRRVVAYLDGLDDVGSFVDRLTLLVA